MKPLHPVVWSEGTILTQQHFQAWEEYWEEKNRQGLHLQKSYFWGFSILDIDESSLLSGHFSIQQCQAIFQNGLMITFDAKKQGPLMYTLPTAG